MTISKTMSKTPVLLDCDLHNHPTRIACRQFSSVQIPRDVYFMTLDFSCDFSTVRAIRAYGSARSPIAIFRFV